MIEILTVMFTFFLSTASSDHVLVRYGVNERVSIAIATLFGVLCAIFLSAAFHVLR